MPKNAVRAALERRLLDADFDRLEDGDVDGFSALVRMWSPSERLVGVDADAADPFLAGGVERAETAAARDLEDDVGALRDLVERDLLALRLVDEVLRVAVQDLDVRVRVLRALPGSRR